MTYCRNCSQTFNHDSTEVSEVKSCPRCEAIIEEEQE